MKIGLTGGTGFIGQYVLKENANEHEFVVVTSRDTTDGLFVHPNVKYVTAAYSQNEFEKAFEGCDAVVHLGAKRSSKEAEESVLNYTDNLRVSEDLFKACNNLNIKNIVNISSYAVYDTTLPLPFEESLAVAPLSNYGVMKHTIEGLAHLYNRKYAMNIKSLRLAQVMGVGERGGYMLSIFLERCLAGQVLTVYGKGVAGREYVYVKDVSKAVMCALKSETKKEVFNIGNGYITTNLELAQAFCEVFNNKEGCKCLEDKKEIVEHYLMSGELAETELGFKPDYTLESALSDMKGILENR